MMVAWPSSLASPLASSVHADGVGLADCRKISPSRPDHSHGLGTTPTLFADTRQHSSCRANNDDRARGQDGM
eukprot:1757858-Rhodomonas_salina.2